MSRNNPRVYVDISIGGRGGGRVVFELFADLTPRTAENFRGLCTGEYGQGRTTKKRLCLEGCSFFRSVKGVMLQSGDFQFNNGDGGESIFGGTFNDEDFSRRHTQAGVLSMANRGRNSNASQFFVTMKRTPQFDGKHVAFGQVVGGMDVLRAVAAVPTDQDDRPRVPVLIVGCGEADRKTRSQADAHEAMARGIAALADEGEKQTEVERSKAILAGKQGGVPVLETSRLGTDAAKDIIEDAALVGPPARNERERRLFELRLRMNQSRTANSKETVEEQKRIADPSYTRKKAEKAEKAESKEASLDKEERNDSELRGAKRYLNETAELAEQRDAKKKKANPDAFGWDVFNQDSLARAHDKRLKTVGFDEQSYNAQVERAKAGDVSSTLGFGFQASEEQKDRLAEAMDTMKKKRSDFSRRRTFVDEEDVSYINDRNRHFNKKLQRSFGEYTHELRQNLERGTAL